MQQKVSERPPRPQAPNMKEDDMIREENANERGVMDKLAKNKVSFLSKTHSTFLSLDIFNGANLGGGKKKESVCENLPECQSTTLCPVNS